MKYQLLVLLFVIVLLLCELPPTYRVLAQNPLTDTFVGAWWNVQRSHPYSSPSQIIADIATLKAMNFNGLVIVDDDLRQYLWGVTNDNDPSQYRSALIAQECQKNDMMFLFIFSFAALDPDSSVFRNSFGPRLQVIANYFKQFSNFRGFEFDDWLALGGLKVGNYAEWDSWLRSQFNIGRPYWITYDDSWVMRSQGWPLADRINQPYTTTGCYYSQTFDSNWIDDFATDYSWANYPNHNLGLLVSSWRYPDAPGQWSPDTIRPWIQKALQYPLFKTFIYFGWRLSGVNQDIEWSNTLAKHPEWWSEIATINALIGIQPPPSTGTLRVFATCQGLPVATMVSVTGPESKTGYTTTDPPPLTFEVAPGAYTVSGIYDGNPQSIFVTVVAGQTADANLAFGGVPPPPPYDSRFLFLGAVAVFAVGLWYGSKRLSKRTKGRPSFQHRKFHRTRIHFSYGEGFAS